MELFSRAQYAERPVGDPLDRCYTPQALADACVARLLPGDAWVGPWGDWVEPSVGGGAFARALRRRAAAMARHCPGPSGPRFVGVDIDPHAPGFRLVDEAVFGEWMGWPRASVIGGNVPFSVALEHVRITRRAAPAALFGTILPVAYVGVGEWQSLFASDPPTEVHPIVGRPWPKKVRETAFYVWRGQVRGPTELVLPGIEGSW